MPLRRTIAILLLLAAPSPGQAPQDQIVQRYKQILAANPASGAALDRLWKTYLDQGRTAELIAEYQNGGTLQSQLVLGHLLRKTGRDDEAQTAYTAAASLDEKSPLPPLALARLAAVTNHSREAASWYEKAVALLPRDARELPDTLLQLGTQWLNLGDAKKAAEAWELIIGINPNDLELRRRLADTYADNHLTARAITHLEYLVEHSAPAERAQALERIARLHQGAGDQNAAIAALEKALALTTPGNWMRAELQSQLIRLHQRYHRTAELELRWKKYAAANPREITAYLQLVDLYERLGHLEQERYWIEKLTQLVPKNADYRLRLARLLVQMDHIDEAAARYDVLLQEQPANPDYIFERARIDIQRDAAQTAQARIQRLIELRKNDEIIRARALEFYQQNRLDQFAEAHLTEEALAGGDDAIIALANFYASHQRPHEAEAALLRLVRPNDKPERQAAARLKIAQLLKGHGMLPVAVAQLDLAAKLQPKSREIQLLLGELLNGQGERERARAALEKAVELSKTPAEIAEADQKLFQSFTTPPTEALAPTASGRLAFTPPRPPDGSRTLSSSPELEQHIAELTKAATDAPTEAAWLRVAQWRGWNRDVKAAQSAVQKALAINPQSIVAHEQLVRLATIDGPSPAAVFQLMQLAEIDPERRAEYQLRAGQIDLQAGRIPEALSTFSQLAQQHPGSIEALTDLALTQQRSDLWKEALDTWRKIYALSAIAKKKDAFVPLLRVLDRLEMHQQSAELQLKAIETEADEREQFRLFGELLAHCEKHALLEWLQTQFAERRKLRADDYFTEMALGRILKAMGNKAAAFEVLADASFAAPNQAEALPELVREAEELHKLDAAVKLQSQLLVIVPQTQPDAYEKLARLQEKDFDLPGASKTWDRIIAKFPRDPAMLGSAVDFQLRWGAPPKAAELLRRVRSLDPANLKALSTLARLDLELGEAAEAEACLEQILKNSKPEETDAPVRYPSLKPEDAARLQSAYLTTIQKRGGRASTAAMSAFQTFWSDEAGAATGELALRLEAIQQLAQLTRSRDDPAALKAWTERWTKAEAASEALAALYYAGAAGAVLDRVESLIASRPNDAKPPQAFIWLALQTGQFSRLSAWLQDRRRPPGDRDYLLLALGQYLGIHEGKLDPRLVEQLFPKGFDQRLWQCASLFAERDHFREAALLGERVFAHVTSQRAGVGRALSHWWLLLGEREKAMRVLEEVIAMPGESFDSDAFGALREYYLLLPEKERPDFLENYLADIDELKEPLRRAIAGAILRGLSGDEDAAQKHLFDFIELRPLATLSVDETAGSASARRWRMLLIAGMQLQAWHCGSLAIDLWERALEDAALLQLQSDDAQEITRELRQRLYALRTAQAVAFDAQRWIDAFGRVSVRDGLIPLGEALEALGDYRCAIEVYRQMWNREPSNPQALRNLLNACRSGNDLESAEEALWKCATDASYRINDSTQRDFVLQLADLLERKGEIERARAVVSQSVETPPLEVRLLLRLAQLHQRAGSSSLSEAVYRKVLTVEPENPTARLALAELMGKSDRIEPALALLEKGGSPEIDAQLALLQLKAGRSDDAISTIDRIPAPKHIAPALALADALATAGERKRARSVVQAAIARTTDAPAGFPLLCKAVELLAPADGTDAAQIELRRLRQMATQQPNLLTSYLEFAAAQSSRLGLERAFADELNGLWADGAGPMAAGVALLSAQTKADSAAAAKTLDLLLGRDDAGEVWLSRIASVLEGGASELLVRVRAQLVQTNATSSQLYIDWSRALQNAGKSEEARAVLERLAQQAVIMDAIRGKVAQAFADLGDRERARTLFAEAVQADPYVQNFQTWLNFGRLQLAMGDLPAARATLAKAFENPANRDFTPLVDWIAAADRLDHASEEVAAFGLGDGQQVALRRALFERFIAEKNLAGAVAMIDGQSGAYNASIGKALAAQAKAAAQFEEAAALLENFLKQTPDNAEITAPLAQLYGDWAAAELSGGGKAEPALAHLRRARQLRPEAFEFMRELCTLLSRTGANKAAIETLENFLTTATNPSDIDQAQDLLTRVKAGSRL